MPPLVYSGSMIFQDQNPYHDGSDGRSKRPRTQSDPVDYARKRLTHELLDQVPPPASVLDEKFFPVAALLRIAVWLAWSPKYKHKPIARMSLTCKTFYALPNIASNVHNLVVPTHAGNSCIRPLAATCTKLEQLYFWNCQCIGENAFEAFDNLIHLKIVHICDCPMVTFDGLSLVILNCPRLETMVVQGAMHLPPRLHADHDARRAYLGMKNTHLSYALCGSDSLRHVYIRGEHFDRRMWRDGFTCPDLRSHEVRVRVRSSPPSDHRRLNQLLKFDEGWDPSIPPAAESAADPNLWEVTMNSRHMRKLKQALKKKKALKNHLAKFARNG
ncbi:hypothetical protein HKX48_006767 [Thoreauomyces humboldtii]|nr:hypothetical protein HKX48_006767 [Thoreauomyces humboldtii]